MGPTEIGGFGISHPRDLLLVEQVVLVPQQASLAFVQFDDAAVADYFDAQVDRGLRIEQFGRIWIHTHPGVSAAPSVTDRRTWDRVFGAVQWSVMCIVARGGATYAELRYQVGPPGSFRLAVAIDDTVDFGPTDRAAWEAEYVASVRHWTPAVSRDFDLGMQPFETWEPGDVYDFGG